MKEKNGFVFVETIVVCAILSVSLVAIYSAFILLVNDQKKRNRYDQAIYNYRLYTITKKLQTSTDNVLNSCGSYTNFKNNTLLTNDLITNLNIEQLYYVNSDNLKNGIPSGFEDYVATINVGGGTCLLIGKFKREVNGKTEYYFSHLTVQKG